MITNEYKEKLIAEYKECKAKLRVMEEEREKLADAIRDTHKRLCDIKDELVEDLDRELGVEGFI